MITSASKALLFALVLSAGSAIAAGQLELGTCDTQRQRCVDRCGLSTPSFDCDMSENGMALAFSCACTDGGTNVDMPTPVVVANTDSASNTEDSPGPSYCDLERMNCIRICANSTATDADGSVAKVESFPVFYCEEDSDIEGSVRASSCACDSDINMNEADDPMAPAGERSIDPSPLDPCHQRQLECEQSCEGLVPDFQCRADGDPNGASFSIASACSCASGDPVGATADGAKSGRAAEDAERAENGAAYDSGYRAGAKYVAGSVLSTLALVQAVADGE